VKAQIEAATPRRESYERPTLVKGPVLSDVTAGLSNSRVQPG
jgi:hypothetical protein